MCFVYDSCMATKTISIELDVYEMLKELKASPSESFSEVIRRTIPRRARTVREISALYDAGELKAGILSDEDVSRIESARDSGSTARDPRAE